METERAYAMAKELGRKDGLLVGVSAAVRWPRRCRLPSRRPCRTRGGHRHHPLRFRRQVPQRALLAGGVTAMLKLSYADYQALRAHGEQTYPHECCGVLLGNAAPDGNQSAAQCAPAIPQRPRPRPL